MSKTHIILDEIVAAKPPLGARVAAHDILTITDLEGQRAVDFRYYELTTRKTAITPTIRQVQDNIYVGQGSMLYCDHGVL